MCDDGDRAPSTQELSRALRVAETGVWAWDARTGQVRWSPELERLFGVEVGSFAGTFEAWRELIHPADLSHVDAALAAAVAGGGASYRFEHRVARSAAGERWLRCVGAVERDASGALLGTIGTTTDVTAEREAVTHLREREAQYRLFSELASDYVYIIELSDLTRPTIVAGSFERTTGYTLEGLVEAGGWYEVMLPEHRAAAARLIDELRRGQPVVHEYRIVDGHGEVRWLQDRIRPLADEHGVMVRFMGGVRDITERKQLEEQLIHAQKLEGLARLAGTMAHDFSNLVLILQAAVHMLGKTAPGTIEHGAALGDLRQVSERAAELTRSLLAFARRQVTETRSVTVAHLLREAEPILRRVTGETVELRLEPGTDGLAVRTDPGKIQLALINLVSNARDAMPGGGTVTISAREVRLGQGDLDRPPELAPGRWVVLDVRDTGIGMTPEVRSRVFEPFFTTKGASGTGLGLATSHGIARQLGGTITVSSTPGRGASFRVYLSSHTEGDPFLAPDLPKPGSVGGTERILLVEDDADVRRVASRTLQDVGYQVREAKSAEEALALTEGDLGAAQLLVSDVRLGGMSGAQLAERLAHRFPALRVLLVSGYVEDAGALSIVSSGRFLFLAKPFSPDGLVARVREALDAAPR